VKIVNGQPTAEITIAVGPSSGSTPVQEVTSWGSVPVGFTLDLESGSNMQFVSRADAPEVAYIDEMATDIWVMGDVQARFRISAVWQEWFSNGQDNVSVSGVSYKKLLSRRLFHSNLAYNDTDLGTIIWNMWAHTQALPGGNLGVTLGTPSTTGIIRDREYKAGENIGTQAENEYDEGIWWTVDHNLVYTAGTLATRSFVGSPLHMGSNVRELQRASGSDFANGVYGDADSDKTTGVFLDAADVATDPRGRWELAAGWPTVVLQDTLDQRTAAFLSDVHTVVAHWNVTLESSRWLTDTKIMPGDFCVLVVPRSLAAPIGVATPRIVVQVTQVQIGFDADGKFEVKAVVMEHPEVPLPS
jgi:hypothetical protein